MATTFATTAFRNFCVNMLTGVNTPTPTPIGFIQPFNGTQPTDPSVAIGVQTSPYTAGTTSIATNGFLSAASGGISSLNQSRSTVAANAVSSLNWARIFNTSGTALIDCAIGLASGGVIVDALSSTVGNALTATAFSLKLPSFSGTIILGQALNNRMVDVWTGNSSTIPGMGTSSLIDIYDGSVPTSADLAATGTKLATFTGNATNWWNAAANGSATLISNPSTVAIASGTASYFRWYKTVSNIVMVVQGNVGIASSDAILNTVTLVSGVTTVNLTELTLSF